MRARSTVCTRRFLCVWLTVPLAFLLSACITIEDRATDPDDEASDAVSELTATPEPTIPLPTPVPSGSMLRLDGIAARQVVLWDAELPAEFAATRYVLYRRSDSRTWSRVGDLPVEGHILADPANPDLLYLGDQPPCLSESEPVPFHRSIDGGKTWQEINDARNIRPILVWPEDRDVIIGSRCGLAISQDAGLTWERHLPESEFDLTRLTATQVGLFGVFTSESGVSHLRRISIENPDQPEFDESILSFWGTGAIHATQERILVGEVGGVHFSDDGGRTWSSTREGLDDVVSSVDPLEDDIPESELESGLGIYALLPHPVNPSRIFLGTIRGVYLSEDSGQTWGRIQDVGDHPVQDLHFSMGGSILYVTTNEGVIVLHNP
jgi:photosystem II stability/assembly factor-like uncharacterized protein